MQCKPRGVADGLAEWEALNGAGVKVEADSIQRAKPDLTDLEVFLDMVQRRY